MKILIIDCSNGNYVSLISGDKIIERKNDSKVSDDALKMIDECLNEAKIKTANLDAVAVSIGPGSFTGIRVGLTIAKTMSFVSKIPLIAFT
ncbi:MAG: tRNA (adenosine(37)-N6)-threonylcarbamoyltransferase complex dimerization subunit type 1 TsaB, partial [Clostridia bacterium]|nr:tRNA (adenosine(37)-N6)-threonylcarbamoyltransferase complex dimerization subunit type 1 TsaB [Clostridia bacterium]